MESEMKRELEKRVKYVVSLSKEIPWYVRKYKELGIDPDEIKSPQDLLRAYEKGLYTTPADLPELVYHKHPEAIGPFYTSGTTGEPKEIWLNPDDEEYIKKQFSYWVNTTVNHEDIVLNCLPEKPAISGYMTNIALSSLNRKFFHFPSQKIRENFQEFVKKLKEINPTHIMTLTTFAYRLPLLLNSIGIDTNNLNVKRVSVGAEPSSVNRRKIIGNLYNADVYDVYASSENGMIAYEEVPFSDEYRITIPWILLLLLKDNGEIISEGEIGNVVLTKLYEPQQIPWSILINYKIEDFAKCVESDDNLPIYIGEIRREAAILAGAKLNPQEVERCIEELEKYKSKLTGEYCIINYDDNERKAIAEVRIESRENIPREEEEVITQEIRKEIYSINFPVWNEVENVGNAKLVIKIVSPGKLYEGYEKYIKPGKPKRLIRLTDE